MYSISVSALSAQLDADRDEEEVFSDISMMVDNKLFPTKEPVAGNDFRTSLDSEQY